jgi:hypothetical protein
VCEYVALAQERALSMAFCKGRFDEHRIQYQLLWNLQILARGGHMHAVHNLDIGAKALVFRMRVHRETQPCKVLLDASSHVPTPAKATLQ